MLPTRAHPPTPSAATRAPPPWVPCATGWASCAAALLRPSPTHSRSEGGNGAEAHLGEPVPVQWVAGGGQEEAETGGSGEQRAEAAVLGDQLPPRLRLGHERFHNIQPKVCP